MKRITNILLTVTLLASLTGCTVINVASAGVHLATTTVSLAAKGVTATAKGVGKGVKAIAHAGDDKKDD